MKGTAVSNCKVSRSMAVKRRNAVETLYAELRYTICTTFVRTKPKQAFSQTHLGALFALVMLTVGLPTFGMAADSNSACFAREGKKPIINKPDMLFYQRKLFLTPDEMARYLFLTNRRDDGDRSAAVYRAQGKKESLPGYYWVTATFASDSLINNPKASVRRFDAPLPSSVAKALHELWLEVCQQSRTDEEALPSAPTGVFSVVASGGTRLTVVTVSLLDEHSLCISLLNLSGLLGDYAKLPAAKRPQAAAEIEKESHSLLKRVTKRS